MLIRIWLAQINPQNWVATIGWKHLFLLVTLYIHLLLLLLDAESTDLFNSDEAAVVYHMICTTPQPSRFVYNLDY